MKLIGNYFLYYFLKQKLELELIKSWVFQTEKAIYSLDKANYIYMNLNKSTAKLINLLELIWN